MRWVAALVALCGCNQVFGLDTTQLQDATVHVDAPPDAAPVCPPAGTQLRIAGPLAQAVRQSCSQYTGSWPTRIAVANCSMMESSGTYVPAEGRIDDSMGPMKMTTSLTNIDLPRISPEGDEVYFRAWSSSGTGYVVEVFARQTDGTWLDTGALPIAPSGINFMTQPTRAPHRHVMLAYGTSIIEYADDGTGGWSQVGEVKYADIGMTQFLNPTLTADGLRLVFGGYTNTAPAYRVYVSDRLEIGGRFTAPKPILDLPDNIYDAYIPDNCSRVYFGALGSIFSAPLAY